MPETRRCGMNWLHCGAQLLSIAVYTLSFSPARVVGTSVPAWISRKLPAT